VNGGKAPGKLAVARAANTRSGSAASAPVPLRRKDKVSRCSVSSTSGGEFSRKGCGKPWKSVTVTERSSGWPGGSRGTPVASRFIASSASSRIAVNPGPANGGANQRARTKVEILARISSRCAASLSCSIAPRRPDNAQASGSAAALAKRERPLTCGSISRSTSAASSHRSVSGSSELPVAIASARKMALIPPALAPARMSTSTRTEVPPSPRSRSRAEA
jgi:hypothetical protein